MAQDEAECGSPVARTAARRPKGAYGRLTQQRKSVAQFPRIDIEKPVKQNRTSRAIFHEVLRSGATLVPEQVVAAWYGALRVQGRRRTRGHRVEGRQRVRRLPRAPRMALRFAARYATGGRQH